MDCRVKTTDNIASIVPETDVLVMGAGLAGLTVAQQLTQANHSLIAIERDKQIGGLARTIKQGDFRFDLGGHRFLTNDRDIDEYVKTLLQGDYLTVSRTSKILLNKKYFDYPLRPLNSVFGLGLAKSLQILADYAFQKLKNRFNDIPQSSLQDWVTAQFGRTMFELYFKQYSEKVWGIDCNRIAREWITQRIQGLSLGDAVKAALFNRRQAKHTTLTDQFIYPHLGIGAIAERLAEQIVTRNEIATGTSLLRLHHDGEKIQNAVVSHKGRNRIIKAKEYVSSIPLTAIVRALSPAAPQKIVDAVNGLRFRDLVIVTLMVNRDRVTDQTWIYFPDKDIPFGRIHEPTNWSANMAPPGHSSLVAEYFCFKGDETWNTTDEQLVEQTISGLQSLDILDKGNVIDSRVLRIPNAYPLFEVGFQEKCETILDYLDNFQNLSVTGRGGSFRYFNMDHTIASGMSIAHKIMNKKVSRGRKPNRLSTASNAKDNEGVCA